jgi:hypothetical protein
MQVTFSYFVTLRRVAAGVRPCKRLLSHEQENGDEFLTLADFVHD